MKSRLLASPLASLIVLLLVAWTGGLRPMARANDSVLISEFMANNSRSLADENGDFSDWIEIYNAGTTTVNLLNYCLTDNASNPAKWRFPATNLPPGRFLVVFASEKNRRIPGAPLHTNFRLSADGEYLGLFLPDAATRVSEFAPLFPPQRADVAYGQAATGTDTALISLGGAARAWVPVDESLGLNWSFPTFDDSTWVQGTTAIGYERSHGYESLLGLNLLSPTLPAAHRIDRDDDGINENTSVYIRIPFLVESPSGINSLALRMRYDDGFVAYLNGQEVARANQPPNLTWNSSAASDYGDVTDVMVAISYGPGNNITIYRNGEIYAPASAATLGTLQSYPANVADVLIGKRHEDLGPGGTRTGADGFLAGSINEARLYNSALNGQGVQSLFRSGPAPGTNALVSTPVTNLLHQWTFNDGTARDSVGSAHGTLFGGAQIEQGRLVLDGIDDFMRSSVIRTNIRERTLVVWLSLDNLGQQAGSAMTLENPTGGDTFDGIVFAERVPGQWMNGSSFFARSVADNRGPPETVTDVFIPARPELFDISVHTDLLTAGTNILAIHGLNFSPSDSDFLILPELTAGRYLIGTGAGGYFADSTPGRMNGGTFRRVQANLFFDHVRGFQSAPFSLTITSDVPGVTIRYTLDGRAPNLTNSLVYVDPILIGRTTTLRASAFLPGFDPAEPVTQTFLFPADILQQTNTAPPGAHWDTEMDRNVVNNPSLPWSVAQALVDLPTVSVVMNPDDLFGENGIYQNATARGEDWERGTSIEFFYPPEYQGRRVDSGFAIHCGIQINGNFSRLTHQPKHSFRLVFKDRWGAPKLRFPLFADYEVDEFDTLLLACGHNQGWSTGIENSQFLRNRFTWDMESMGEFQPKVHSQSVHVYLNGMYWGLYDLHERPDESFAAANFGGSKEEYDVFKGLSAGGSTSAPLINGTRDDWDELFVRASRNLANPTNYAAVSELVDIGQLIDYSIGILYSADRDGPTGWLNGPPNSLEPKNFYASKRRTADGRFRFWRWDSEFTFETVTEDVSERQGTENPGLLHYKLRSNPEYRLRFADRVQELFFNDGPFTVAELSTRYSTLAAELDRAVVAESARWGDSKREPPFSREVEWIRERDRILNSYIPGRLNVFLSQLRADGLFPAIGVPVFHINGWPQHGGLILPNDALSLTSTNGQIYYTLDGSDPRDPSQATSIASQALAYTAPIVLADGAIVSARVLNGTQWSPLVDATFYVTQDYSALRLTEVMYHPLETNGVEFLELKNIGSSALNLERMKLSGGVDFTFPRGTLLRPNGFLVLVSDAEAFKSRHPGIPFAGVFRGQLNNNGDTLRLTHPVRGLVLEMTYGDSAPWPVSADGLGFSLVPRETEDGAFFDAPSAWRASTAAGGSPGHDDPTTGLPRLVINEVLTAATAPLLDSVELWNPTELTVNIGGWFLTDDPALPRKFRIPDGVTLAPGGFAVFDESHFNQPALTTNAFALSSRGDQIYLFSADASGQLTGYDHGFSFDAAPEGVSLGRLVLSTGEEAFPAQTTRTFGGVNSSPRIGPVVLTEIHYNPPAPEDAFVELQNISSGIVSFDPTPPSTNTWRLNGVDFEFPPGVTLMPEERLLITAGHPQAFRDRFQVPSGIRILGPWAGRLQSKGERLQLQRPAAPDSNPVAYITVDEVRYDDREPWPVAADGTGASLQRLGGSLYGNERLHWAAALATPGMALHSGDAPVILSQPVSLENVAYRDIQFSVTATGQPPLNYQWWFNHSKISGATHSTLLLTNVQPGSVGTYRVSVWNSAGSVVSSNATLNLRIPATITQQPRSRNVTNNGIATLSVAARGRGPLRYQWQFDGVNLPNATNATLTLSNVTIAATGPYRVIVSDEFGSSPSQLAFLTVLVRPTYLVHPLSQSVVQGDAVSFTAVADATFPVTFRLRRGTSTLATQVLNTGTVTFTLNNLQPGNAGSYTIVAANAANLTGVVSTSASLTVLADSDGDRLPDFWETLHGFNPANPGEGALDSDGDTLNNRAEYIAGTDPTNASSYLRLDQVIPGAPTRLLFQAVSNRTYRVEHREELQQGSWQLLQQILPRTTNHVGVVIDPSEARAARFYRLLIPAEP
ncbi:MAG: lamin tail domain-containing protein [Verrucomicrobiales bacterium]|nr:lamin tail domain-containing protein [Verrucomicrobiales bacterium]